MKYDLMIFDFDGTLADTFRWFAKTTNILAKKYGFKTVSQEEIDLLRSCNVKEVIKYLKVKLWQIPSIAKDIRSMMQKEIYEIDFFPGVKETLQDLHRKGVKIGICSSNSVKNVQTILEKNKIDFINHIEGGIGLFGKKGKIHKIINKYDLPSDQVIYIGDEIRDIEASRSAKVSSGVVSWGYYKKEALLQNKPDFLYNKISDLFYLHLS